jgi:hypothetical protein
MSRYAIASFLEAEVKCYHCGHTSGVIRREQGVPRAPAMFQNADGGPAVAVKSLTALRCTRCQGSVFIDEFDVRYDYPKVEFLDDERPRRGRPPKRLVELRRAQEAAQEAALKSA